MYLKPLPEALCDNSQIRKLNKCVYGLADASLMWFKRVKKIVDENNGTSPLTWDYLCGIIIINLL